MRKVGILFVALGILFFAVGPALAQQPTLTILSPKEGETIKGPNVSVAIKVTNFLLADFDAELTTMGVSAGHVHISLDTQPWNKVQTLSPTYTITGVMPGKNTLTVELFHTDHRPLSTRVVKSVTFQVE